MAECLLALLHTLQCLLDDAVTLLDIVEGPPFRQAGLVGAEGEHMLSQALQCQSTCRIRLVPSRLTTYTKISINERISVHSRFQVCRSSVPVANHQHALVFVVSFRPCLFAESLVWAV
jgi:hypothetical protein